MNQKSVSFISSIGLILTAAIWGFAFVIVKDSLNYVGSIWMIAFRFTIAAILLAIIFCKKFKMINKSYLFHGGILGLFLFLAYLVQTIGCNFTTAGKNAFLTTIYVILIPLISWPLYRKRPKWYVFIAGIICLTGIGFLALAGEKLSLTNINIGDVITLICGFFYAIHIIYVEKWNQEEDPILLTVLQFIYVALFAWILAPFVKDSNFNGPFPLNELKNSKVIFSMLYLGIFSTMIAFFLQNLCLKYVPSALASLFLSLESVFGVIFSTIILKEYLSFRMIIGCVLIFFAIVLAEVIPNIKKIDNQKE
jgi:drug/metabolite transporter (DMT)-like permease